VVYYFDEDFGTYHYSTAHPMKPIRVEMTDELIRKYELDKHMDRIVI
jgi:histone deacetylase 1/2